MIFLVERFLYSRGLAKCCLRRLIACRPRVMREWREPPICLRAVFAIVLSNACFADFRFVATSTNSGAPCTKSSRPILLAVGHIKFLANGRATLLIPAARAPKPLPLDDNDRRNVALTVMLGRCSKLPFHLIFLKL